MLFTGNFSLTDDELISLRISLLLFVPPLMVLINSENFQSNSKILSGDFAKENVPLVQSVAALPFPKAVILGNHDARYTHDLSRYLLWFTNFFLFLRWFVIVDFYFLVLCFFQETKRCSNATRYVSFPLFACAFETLMLYQEMSMMLWGLCLLNPSLVVNFTLPMDSASSSCFSTWYSWAVTCNVCCCFF